MEEEVHKQKKKEKKESCDEEKCCANAQAKREEVQKQERKKTENKERRGEEKCRANAQAKRKEVQKQELEKKENQVGRERKNGWAPTPRLSRTTAGRPSSTIAAVGSDCICHRCQKFLFHLTLYFFVQKQKY